MSKYVRLFNSVAEALAAKDLLSPITITVNQDGRHVRLNHCGGKVDQPVYVKGTTLDDLYIVEKTTGAGYLCFECIAAGFKPAIKLVVSRLTTEQKESILSTLEYSRDGETWYAYTEGTQFLLYNVGEKVYWRGNCPRMGFSEDNYAYFQSANGGIKLTGDVNCLLSKDNYTGLSLEGKDYCYRCLFNGSNNITYASGLVLSSKILAPHCYERMFSYCEYMEDSPVISATTLADYCYHYMFDGCQRMTSAPALPVTTLAKSCYMYMFENCVRLQTAPVLPASVLTEGCYYCMFRGCGALCYIKCLATDLSASDCTRVMTRNVAYSGTFVKKKDVVWPSGEDGIPSAWTIEEVE